MSVVRSVEVPVDPGTAFRMFTEEIDDWYERGPYSWNDPDRAVAIRFERGRLLEVWDDGDGYEMGLVTAWEPGERLAFAYRSTHLPSELETEVEVRFDPIAAGTRVTLEHRGLELLPPDEYERWRMRAWAPFVETFRRYVNARKNFT
jgi:Activator of Hsp90 ATPase homolog 1-like protein